MVGGPSPGGADEADVSGSSGGGAKVADPSPGGADEADVSIMFPLMAFPYEQRDPIVDGTQVDIAARKSQKDSGGRSPLST
jgi:hypothetical protein